MVNPVREENKEYIVSERMNRAMTTIGALMKDGKVNARDAADSLSEFIKAAELEIMQELMEKKA
ncbi:hypothetical protein [Niallia nealsonii]|uniref:Uncharacterized protein n=1 Tax=Niallia nealsonii TaxID=115979 RepID=A0A2N0YZK0_9BACI|nr:hypothetical protein [Niallia nealsonii]PKG22683.1 hypothetical protein CWS01_16270 [Niallia nealsonii]